MTDLSRLQPSLRLGPISAEELRKNPVGGVYWLVEDGEDELPIRINQWSCAIDNLWRFAYSWLSRSGQWTSGELWCLPENVTVFYIKATHVSFSLTAEQMRTPGDQPTGRCKSVTRRQSARRGCQFCGAIVRPEARRHGRPVGLWICPEHGGFLRRDTVPLLPLWAKLGRIFNAWSGSFRTPPRPDYLGTFRVVSAEMAGRWRCSCCKTWLPNAGRHRHEPNPAQPHYRWFPAEDTLTSDELTLEGFPDADPDEWWAGLVKSGNVDESGRCARVGFKEVGRG